MKKKKNSIIRDKEYVMVNKDALWDKNLSLESVGLLARLLSLNDVKDMPISEICLEDKSTIDKILKELSENDYIEVEWNQE